MLTRYLKISTTVFAFLFTLAGCQQGNTSKESESEQKPSEEMTGNESATEGSDAATTAGNPMAMATISGASGKDVSGEITFEQTGESTVKMTLSLQKLTRGKHALHLHENGDCSADDATSAGGHWNPTGTKHGKRGEGEHHKGDIANIDVPLGGEVTTSYTIEGWTIGGADESNILNKAVIIHAGEDDFTSQPSGAAGARVACGVIQAK